MARGGVPDPPGASRRPSHDALASIRGYLEREEHRVIGLMTGTSADAVDAALVRFTGLGLDSGHEIVAYRETPLDSALRREILDFAGATHVEPERLMRLDAALAESFAAAVLELLAAARLDPRRVDAIGSHGQTVRHLPRGAGDAARTLQLGSASILAERTGIAVVSDFRTRDTAAGGEGAPLVPIADWWLFRSEQESRVLLNVGGIANLTWLPRGKGLDRVVALDTGPGNAVMDALVRTGSGGLLDFDAGGERAARGQPSEALLSELLSDPFFTQAPPRSTGREKFGDRYAHQLREMAVEIGLSDEDLLATALELTAAAVEQGVRSFVATEGRVDAVYVSGGGARNATLMAALARRLAPARLLPLGALGVAAEAKEALAFAFLAHLTLCGVPGNVPRATGASHPVVLGHITPGAAQERTR